MRNKINISYVNVKKVNMKITECNIIGQTIFQGEREIGIAHPPMGLPMNYALSWY